MRSRAKTKLVLSFFVVVFLAFGTCIVYGQEKEPIVREKMGMGYFMGGVGMVFESGDNSVIFSLGGGGHSLKNRLIIGGEGHSSFGSDNAGGYGFFDLGYALLVTDSVVLYPLVGIGGGALTRVAEPSVSKCALLNPAIGFDYLINRKDKSGILLGLRLGYTFTLYSNTWNWSMPYIRILIGAFGAD